MSSALPDVVLEVRGLSIGIDHGRGEVPLVRDLSFELRRGEIVGLVGESGSGKSLTALALLGLLPTPPAHCHAGSLRLEGRDLAGLDEHGWRRVRGAGLALIFQDPQGALDPVFTVGRQLAQVIHRHRQLRGAACDAAAREALERVGLDATGVFDRYPHELSGGMRQRVAVAMAVGCRPRVLIADEPTTALDVTTQSQVLALIRESAAALGAAVLLITHDLAVVAQVCDRVLLMHAGQIVEQGPVFAVFENPAHEHTVRLLGAIPRLPPRRNSCA